MAFTSVTLTGTVEASPGVGVSGAIVTATLSSEISDGSTIIEPRAVSAQCDSSGNLPTSGATLTVPANDDSSTIPSGTFYSISISGPGIPTDSFKVIVPHASAPSVDLFSLARLGNAPPASTPFVESVNGQNGVVSLYARPIVLAPVDWVYLNLSALSFSIDAYTYANGTAGVGATVTQNTPSDGALSIDGGTPSVGDRVAFCDVNGGGYAYNGIYTVTALGNGSSVPWVLTRATDCDTSVTLFRNWAVYVGANGTGTQFTPGSQVNVSGFPASPVIGSAYLDLNVMDQGSLATGTATAINNGVAIGNGFGGPAANRAVASVYPLLIGDPLALTYGLQINGGAVSQFGIATGRATVLGSDATALGDGAVAYGSGQIAHAGGVSNPDGVQWEVQNCWQTTTDATPLTVYGATNFDAVEFVNADTSPAFNKTVLVHIEAVARRTDVPGTASGWEIWALVDGDGSSSYRFVGSPTVTVKFQDAAASSWGVALSIGAGLGFDTNGLVLTVTGEAGKTIMWEAALWTFEAQG